jgi:hypothetical protein
LSLRIDERIAYHSCMVDDSESEDTETSLELRLIGNRRSLQSVLTFLQFLESCSTLGTTQWVKMMVDGDGGFRFALERDGRRAPLTEEEQAFLFADADEALPSPAHLAHLYFSRVLADGETTLSVELV